jgi:hypothetical protein
MLALTPRIVRPPPPTPALYAVHAACDAVDGSETSALPELRSTAYDVNLLLESKSINQYFRVGNAMDLSRQPSASLANPSDSICGDEAFFSPYLAGESFGFAPVWSEGSYPRGTAESSRSRYTRARSGPGGDSEISGGQIAARSGSPERRSGRISREGGLAGRLAQAHADSHDPRNPAMGDSWRAASSFAMELN